MKLNSSGNLVDLTMAVSQVTKPFQISFSILLTILVVSISLIPWHNVYAHNSAKQNMQTTDEIVVSQTMLWNEATPESAPLSRNYSTMAFDARTGKIILFGGHDSASTRYGDTWEWDGTNWTQLSPITSPTARSGHAMVYDSFRQKIVLFAGFDGGWPADTWEWDGSNWAKITTATTPPGPTGHSLAYDSVRHRVVLFGGFGANYLAETWEYDGSNWVKRSPTHSPPARAQSTMVYDAAHHKVVLFGGYNAALKYNDIWEWDGTDWSQKLPTTSPDPRSHHTLVYDSIKGAVVLFGGVGSSTVFNDIWEWNGTNWTEQLAASLPSARFGHAAAFDIGRQQMVVFGGQDTANPELGDTWILRYLLLQATPPEQAIAPGASAQFSFSAIGTTDPIHITISGLPAGVTITLNPGADIQPLEVATLTLSTEATVPDGSYPITISGQADYITTDLQVYLIVTHPDFNLAILPIQNSVYAGAETTFEVSITGNATFANPVNLTVNGLPQGMSYSFQTNPANPGVSTQLVISAEYNASPGTYPIIVSGTSGGISHSIQASVVVLPIELSISITPSGKSIYQEQSAIFSIGVNAVPVVDQPIAISIAGLSPLEYQLSSNTILPGSSATLTVFSSLESVAKVYEFVITGSLGSYSQAAHGNLEILPASISISIAPNSKQLQWNESSTFIITTSSTPGFTGLIDLTGTNIDDLDTSFSTNPISAGNSSVLRIEIPSGSKPGIRTITVWGNSNGLQASASALVDITATVYLPMLFNHVLPNPIVLNQIVSPEDGSYTISWTEQPRKLSDGYLVEESISSDFINTTQVCNTTQQSCSVQDKVAGVYYYRVRGYNSSGNGPWSSTQTAIVLLPETPTLNSINNADGDGLYTITWSSTARSSSFMLEESRNTNFIPAQIVYSGNGNSWNVTKSTSGAYYYRVRSVGPTGQSGWSNTQSVQVSAGVSILPNYTTYRTSNYQVVVGEIQNHSPWFVQFVEIVVNFFNGSQLVDTSYTYTMIENVHPGEKGCFKIIVSDLPSWDSYTFEAPTYSTDGTQRPNLTVTSHSGSVYNFGNFYRIIGMVRNDDTNLVRYVSPVATLYNSDGKVVGCDFTYVSSTDLNPQQESSFSLLTSPFDPYDVYSYTLQVDGD